MLESILGGIVLLWCGSMEYRMRKIREDVGEKIVRSEVSELIDLKQEVVKASNVDTRHHIARLEKKIDKLIDLQLNK